MSLSLGTVHLMVALTDLFVLRSFGFYTYFGIERDIRTVIEHAWRNNPEYLSRLAGFPLAQPPSALQFLDILVTFSLRELSQSYA